MLSGVSERIGHAAEAACGSIFAARDSAFRSFPDAADHVLREPLCLTSEIAGFIREAGLKRASCLVFGPIRSFVPTRALG